MFPDFLGQDSETVARRLLGCVLVREIKGQQVVVKIVETEAYDQYDAASHSFNGQTPRTEVMFGPSGYLYVYFTYGMHYCCNVVTGPAGEGSAVLIRAVEPLQGTRLLEERRGKTGAEITNGPAKLCSVLDIDKALNGHNLKEQPLVLQAYETIKSESVVCTTRVGISKAQDSLRRYYIKDNEYVSRT